MTDAAMGYRTLLKGYMQHIETLTGTDFVSVAEMTAAFSPRELGELRSLAAEIQRNRHGSDLHNPLVHALRSLIESGEITIEELANKRTFPTLDLPVSTQETKASVSVDATNQTEVLRHYLRKALDDKAN